MVHPSDGPIEHEEADSIVEIIFPELESDGRAEL